MRLPLGCAMKRSSNGLRRDPLAMAANCAASHSRAGTMPRPGPWVPESVWRVPNSVSRFTVPCIREASMRSTTCSTRGSRRCCARAGTADNATTATTANTFMSSSGARAGRREPPRASTRGRSGRVGSCTKVEYTTSAQMPMNESVVHGCPGIRQGSPRARNTKRQPAVSAKKMKSIATTYRSSS